MPCVSICNGRVLSLCSVTVANWRRTSFSSPLTTGCRPVLSFFLRRLAQTDLIAGAATSVPSPLPSAAEYIFSISIPSFLSLDPARIILRQKRQFSIACFITRYIIMCQSQWPRGLWRRSAAARLLRLWVRIPSGSWMSVCCECCVLSGRGLCDKLITHPEESYRM